MSLGGFVSHSLVSTHAGALGCYPVRYVRMVPMHAAAFGPFSSRARVRACCSYWGDIRCVTFAFVDLCHGRVATPDLCCGNGICSVVARRHIVLML